MADSFPVAKTLRASPARRGENQIERIPVRKPATFLIDSL